jgi:hypothetical protein
MSPGGYFTLPGLEMIFWWTITLIMILEWNITAGRNQLDPYRMF